VTFYITSRHGSIESTFCGGSLIAPDVIMTAAHCVYDSLAIDVWVNSTTRKVSDDEYFQKSICKVIHPKYKNTYNSVGYDIALIFLALPVKEVPIVTRNRNASLPGNIRSLVTVIGFGRFKTSFSGGSPTASTPIATPPFSRHDSEVPPPFARSPKEATTPTQAPLFQLGNTSKHHQTLTHNNTLPEKLMEVQFFMLPKAVCLKSIGSWKVHESEICASEGIKGACYGDSGGPLFILSGSKYIQIGIVARTTASYDCIQPKMPQIFTSTAYFAKWIDENICKFSKHKPNTCSPGKPSAKPNTKNL
jgi:secreted trypsin-like serine protease